MSSNAGSSKSGHVAKMSGKPTDADKFKLYFDFKAYINAIRPHQVCVCLFKLFWSFAFIIAYTFFVTGCFL